MKTLKKSIIIITTIAALAVPMAAKAFLPLAGIAILVQAAGGTVPFAISAATHAAAIGLITLAAKDSGSGSGGSGDLLSKPITVQIDPNVPLITPEGWQDSVTPPEISGRKEGTYSFVKNSNQHLATASSLPELIALAAADFNLTYDSTACASIGTGLGHGFKNQYNGTVCINPPPCQDGYVSISGGFDCALDDVSKVKKPKKNVDEFIRVGDQFIRDPQQDPSDSNTRVFRESPNKISYTDVNTGEKVVVELSTATGAAKVTQTVPNYGNITTSQQVTTISGGSNGTGAGASITGQSTATYSGVGDQMGDTPISGGDGSGSGGGGSGGGSALCEGCATEETLSNIKDVLEGEGAGAESAGEGLAEGFAGTQNGVFSSLGGVMSDMVANSGLLQAYTEKVLPASPWDMAVGGVSSNCEFGFQLLGKTYYLSVCEAQPYLHNAIAFILFFLTAVGVFNLVTERPEGGD